jgi:cell division protein FtsA
MSNYIAGLDIGTHTIKGAIGELRRDGALSLMKMIKLPSHGLRRGVVSDFVEATREVSAALGEIRSTAKGAAQNIFLGVGSAELRVQPSVGVVAVSRADYEIYQDDIQRAIQSSQALSLPPNRMVVHSLIHDFVVDGVRDIRDPLGMVGNRLEVNSLIIDDFAPSLKNLTKCVEVLGGGLGGLILGPIAGARAMLTKHQRELGVLYVDIGFGKTSMAVYEEGKLLHAAVFPMGSGNITNDLAIGLKIPIETAETIKLSFGSALAKEIGSREVVELPKIDPRLRGTVSRKFIGEIIEGRLAEIFEFVAKELAYIGKRSRLPAGVVLAGGGAKLPGIADLAREELRLSAQVGVADASELTVLPGEWSAQVEDPEFACAIGLLYAGRDRALEARTSRMPFRGAIRRVLKYFVP